MPKPLTPQEIERWERVLAAAAKLQSVIPEAFLVGGTAVGIYSPYRTSRDADHLMPDLLQRCPQVLTRLEALAGWSTEVVRGQHTILGRMDGIETTLMDDGRVRQHVPLEVHTYRLQGLTLRLPTLFEILRIKSYLLLFRNMARDYADCHALSGELEDPELFQALIPLEQRYRMRPHTAWSHDGTQKPLSFLYEMGQRLSHPAPRDLKKTLNHWDQRFRLRHPEDLSNWTALVAQCRELGRRVLEIHQVWSTPAAEPELAVRYGVSTTDDCESDGGLD